MVIVIMVKVDCSDDDIDKLIKCPPCFSGNTYAGFRNTLGLGWGFTEAGFISAILLKAQLIPVSNTVCTRAMGAFGQITRNMICAANQDLGADTCQVGVQTRRMMHTNVNVNVFNLEKCGIWEQTDMFRGTVEAP